MFERGEGPKGVGRKKLRKFECLKWPFLTEMTAKPGIYCHFLCQQWGGGFPPVVLRGRGVLTPPPPLWKPWNIFCTSLPCLQCPRFTLFTTGPLAVYALDKLKKSHRVLNFCASNGLLDSKIWNIIIFIFCAKRGGYPPYGAQWGGVQKSIKLNIYSFKLHNVFIKKTKD